MNTLQILHPITKIKTSNPTHTLEKHRLDFKRFPTSFHHENQKNKLTSILREYAYRFASSDGGTLLLGIENTTTLHEAITGCLNYNIKEMRRMIFDGTRPPIIAEIPQPEGMVLVDKTAPHPEPINYDRWSEFHWKHQLQENLTPPGHTSLRRLRKPVCGRSGMCTGRCAGMRRYGVDREDQGA